VTQSLVYLHIIAGSVAVIGMIGALVSRKGGLWHRRTGRLYSYAMAAALLLALIVSVLTVNSFLGLIGLFSGYFVYTGWRLAVVKDGRRSHIDRVASLFMMCCAFAMTSLHCCQPGKTISAIRPGLWERIELCCT